MKMTGIRKGWMAALAAAVVMMVAAVGCTSSSGDTPSAVNGAGIGGIGAPSGSIPVGGVQSAVLPVTPERFVYADGSLQQTGIWVTGTGTVEAASDIAQVLIGVESRETTVSAARGNAADAMTRVLDAIKGLGVAEDDIVTVMFNVRPETVWVEVNDSLGRHSEPRIVGYIVTNTVRVTVRDIEDLGPVVDAAATEGGDLIRIDSISFTVDDPSAFGAQMRTMAAEDARAKAQIYADAMGVQLGSLLFLQEMGSSAPMVQRDYAVAEAFAGAAMPPTPISSGDVTLTSTIQAVFAIQ